MTKEEKQKLNEKELYKLFDKGDIDAREFDELRKALPSFQQEKMNAMLLRKKKSEIVALYKKGELKPIYTSDLIRETHYILEDLKSLDKGSFEYVVYGKSLNIEGIQEQMGKKVLHNFSIILPTLVAMPDINARLTR